MMVRSSFGADRREPRPARPRRAGLPRRAAFTLLEVLLAIALASLLILAVGQAIYLHTTVLDRRRDTVEDAQLVRSLARHMKADLQNVVLYQPIDEADLQGLAGGAAGISGAGAPTDDSGEGSGGDDDNAGGSDPLSGLGGDDPSADELAGQAQSRSQDIANSLAPTDTPGLYGNSAELVVDITRLPRPDEYLLGAANPAALAQPPSDVKTVAYYLDTGQGVGGAVVGAQASASAASSASSPQAAPAAAVTLSRGSGLVRRELNRALAQHAAEGGDLAALENRAEIIAPEVTGLGFRYFDGEAWRDTWDSHELGGLPLAIEVTLVVRLPDNRRLSASEAVGANVGIQLEANERIERFVVRLPAARPLEEYEAQGLEALEGLDDNGNAGSEGDSSPESGNTGSSSR